MLYLFRKSQRWLLWLLLIVVVVTFVFWGTKMPNILGSVSPTSKVSSYQGQKITLEDVQRAKGAARVQLAMYGVPLSEMNDGFLTTQGVHHIVNYRKAEKAGVTVDNSMLQSVIRNFISPGTSQEAYQRYVASKFGISNPREFEEDLRQLMAISIYENDSQNVFFEPKNEKDLDYETFNVKADVKYINFMFTKHVEEASKASTTNDFQELYDKDPQAFAQPDKYRFLVANFKADTNKVQYVEQDLQDYFDLYQGDFTKTNEFGETIDMEFAEARPQVLAAFLQERANEDVQEKALNFKDSITTKEEETSEELENNFKEAAKAAGVPVQDSFTQAVGQVPPMISNGQAIAKAIQDEPVGTLDVYEASDSFYQVYIVVSRSEAFEPTFEEAFNDVKNTCVQLKAYEMSKEEAQGFLEKVKADPKNFEGIATNAKYYVAKTTQPIIPSQTIIRDIPLAESSQLFRYPAETPRLLLGKNNVYVAMVSEFVEADASFDEGKISDRIAQQKSSVEKELYFKSTDEEVSKILAELQGNIVKISEKERR
ncbi:SurA N-terminal domain-containing protein [bacterium]|nr:SurA N-terminal domain-containing protein [bacterium]